MSNAGQEANAEGAVEVAIDDKDDVMDSRTATSERGTDYHRRNIDHRQTSAGKLHIDMHIGR